MTTPTSLTCPQCGDALPDVLPAGWAHLLDARPYCDADCRQEATTPLHRCPYCPTRTAERTCGWPSCERKADRAEDAAVERAVQADLARYQP